MHLYQGVVWKQSAAILFRHAGSVFPFNMFDAQAWYARDVMLGKIALPSFAEMQADTQAWHEEGKNCRIAAAMFNFKATYIMHPD